MTSRPRFTVTLGRQGGQAVRGVRSLEEGDIGAAAGTARMYSDQGEGRQAARSGGSRRLADRLGPVAGATFKPKAATPAVAALRRLRGAADNDKWQHDMYEVHKKAESTSGDLRATLARRSIDGSSGTSVTVVMGGGPKKVHDLREKLSGPIPAPQASGSVVRTAAPARPAPRLMSVVQKAGGETVTVKSGSGARASTAAGRSREPARTQPRAEAAHRLADDMEVEQEPPRPAARAPTRKTVDAQSSIAHLLQSLELSKYLITFQAEEVDMAALQQMQDQDLKELGIPMGPRKKILLALKR